MKYIHNSPTPIHGVFTIHLFNIHRIVRYGHISKVRDMISQDIILQFPSIFCHLVSPRIAHRLFDLSYNVHPCS
jgi:hypothetical protein